VHEQQGMKNDKDENATMAFHKGVIGT